MVIDDGSETESTGSSIDEQGDEPDGHQIAVERALAFLKGLDIDAGNSNVHGIPALLSATWEGRRDVIESLLLVGSPVNAVNANTGDSALMIAASRDDLEVVNVLLDATDIDLDLANKHGDTALMLAASNNCTTVVEALLHCNADVNKVNPVHGYTALLQAADFGWGEIVKMLLRAGAAINAVNPRGDSALILASAGKHREVVRYLLDQGADSKIVDRHGYTGLAAAIAAGDAAVVELFLERGHFLKDFNAAFELQDPFSVTVTDLMARSSNHLSLRTQSKDTLEFFRAVSRMTTPDKDALDLLNSVGLPMACALELVELMRLAQAWALDAVSGTCGRREQHQLICCVTALSQIATSGAMERVQSVYRRGGATSDSLLRLERTVREKFEELADLAGQAAAQLGGELVGKLIARCLAQTSSSYEVRPVELKDILIAEGFIEPLATIIASGWQDVLSNLRAKPIQLPAGLSILESIRFVQQLLTREAHVTLARALKERLRSRALLTSLRAMLVPKQEEVLHILFQVQCDWIVQFCDQSLDN